MGEQSVDPIWLTIGGAAIAALFTIAGHFLTRWMDRSEERQDKDDDLALIQERRITTLELALGHIASDQRAHEAQGRDLQNVKTDVAVLKERSKAAEGSLALLSRQNRAIWAKLNEPKPTASANDGVRPH